MKWTVLPNVTMEYSPAGDYVIAIVVSAASISSCEFRLDSWFSLVIYDDQFSDCYPSNYSVSWTHPPIDWIHLYRQRSKLNSNDGDGDHSSDLRGILKVESSDLATRCSILFLFPLDYSTWKTHFWGGKNDCD